MSDELKAAAERIYNTGPHDLPASLPGQYLEDADDLAEAYLAAEAAREAEAAERAKPIDGDLLLSFGFTVFAEACAWMYQHGNLSVFGVQQTPTNGAWKYGKLDLPQISTKGELLDLLAVLKIPTKAGGN